MFQIENVRFKNKFSQNNFLYIMLGVHSRIKYDELNENNERISEKIYFYMVKMSLVGFLLSPLLTTVTNYYVLDLKEESFLLPAPLTYVSRLCYLLTFHVEKVH